MIRPALTEIALFLSPFAAYALFLIVTRARLFDLQAWSPRILSWLAGIAFVLMIISFVLIAQFSGMPVGSTYIPAHMENGTFVPGRTQ